MIENDRPQDVGRSHERRTRAPAPETAEILERYREAMRAELVDTLEELRPPPVDEPAELVLGADPPKVRPQLPERLKLWDLAIKLGRELANGEEPEWSSTPVPSPAVTRSRPAPKLTARERRALGAS